jgi:hypothetical protein
VGLIQHEVAATMFFGLYEVVHLYDMCGSVFTKFNLVLLTMLWNSLVCCVRCRGRRGDYARDVSYKWLG